MYKKFKGKEKEWEKGKVVSWAADNNLQPLLTPDPWDPMYSPGFHRHVQRHACTCAQPHMPMHS